MSSQRVVCCAWVLQVKAGCFAMAGAVTDACDSIGGALILRHDRPLVSEPTFRPIVSLSLE